MKRPHDLCLHSGERQTATTFADIRLDHRLRYEWADQRIPANTFGIDAFCGNGYGTWLLGHGRTLLGIDGSPEAVELASLHYRLPGTFFSNQYFPFDLPQERFDFVVSLESIEHVDAGADLFKRLYQSLKPGGQLIYSTPCEELLPHKKMNNHFHFKHYTVRETFELAESHGMKIAEWAGQNVYGLEPDLPGCGRLLAESEMMLQPNQAGQFLIVHAVKGLPSPQPRSDVPTYK